MNKKSRKRVLTGIKPTGIPHIGNYLGAILPALKAVGKEKEGQECFYFIADYHALTALHDAKLMEEWTYQVAATWLASGLDPKEVTLYRQSDIPELFELQWILSCFTSKGLMNRAHAYKASMDVNMAKGADPDEGVNVGLFTYPVLMAADILAFETDFVPVGADQVQHVEIARDIATAFNHRFKKDVFRLPAAQVQAELKFVPGLDGRKMSKSYDNTIPLFLPSKDLRKLVMKIKTDSTPPEVAKDPDESLLFVLYQEFAEKAEIESMRQRFQQGIGWGTVKEELYQVIDRHFAPMRERYDFLMKNRGEIDVVLEAGGKRAREAAGPFLKRVRETIGIRW